MVWIVGVLNDNGVPYQIEGGLAANCYGSTRNLQGIDIFIPSDGFLKIASEVDKYSEFGPDYHEGENWVLTYQILNYCGQQIELCDAGDARYLDSETGQWIERDIDFSKAHDMRAAGVPVKVIPKRDLIEYKSRLARDVDLADIKEIS